MRHKSYSQTRPSPWQYVVLAGLAVLFVYPIWWAISSSLKPANDIVRSPLSFSPGSLTLDNYRAMLDDVPLGTGFLNTLLVVAVKGTLTMCLCPLAGYAFAKYRFPGRNLLFGILMLTLMLPTLVLIIPLLLQMSQLGWVNTYQALILPGSIDAFSIFWMRQTIAAVPDELLDAGRVDGAGELRIFARIVVPVIRPGIAALGVLTVMNIYNDFVWPVVAVNDENHQTLQVVLSTLAQNVTGNRIGADFSTVWGELLAAGSLALLPVLLLFVLLQRHFINGILAGSVKG
ncbi:carbohydrate ABC transporter permease [Streptomyces rochei]|uniref:Carbohydrate ABC transporter permease n=2 Tax=Streptomyces rochei group TaxID=2867164 RepID=A0ABW1YAH9_STRPL|nr:MULTISPECIES: carbohydrate ABC transporter permease [Streptomyces rochei group]MBX4173581.1 carbohydrate ABC transporter permease [Streptomyces geysiriensis]NEC76722.1 carbohydrate ABC transporter permease [Streptomyces rochei]WMI55445.1 carbohydrate ABC transporter permease [Streptomyces rochei]GGZ57175.1 sugar transporter [Streptomyces plicatus]